MNRTEMGTKSERIAVLGATYPRENIMMVGDAPGDLRSAQANDVLFFPIILRDEESSWREVAGESLDRFFAGAYRGLYERRLLEQFDRALPESPAWEGHS